MVTAAAKIVNVADMGAAAFFCFEIVAGIVVSPLEK